ncbi:hydroxymethylglutaryl-CoA lyase [Niallia sp. XMNu-256]|uniref:hydroxymethylglutaryl-CoA lyase n=1 Tax=Niallia sp. XMNu-256 TaxID=3082444 RepID=UPI0030D00AF8
MCANRFHYPDFVTVCEVGPRDGLQNERIFVSSEDKIAWINQLSHSGLKYIEITSFVNPKWIPALKDAEVVAKGIERVSGVTYSALVPNLNGLEKAIETNIDEIALFISASETHNRKNLNKSIEDTLPLIEEVAKETISNGKTIRGYISTVFGCPYEGKVAMDKIIRIADTLFEMGIRELSIGDTVGIATPLQVEEVLDALLRRFPAEKVAMHFHDTRGMAIANVLKSLEMGITKFDSSLGGLGGCPYAPGASGNLATDDLLYLLEGMGIKTSVDYDKMIEAAKYIQDKLKKSLSSHTIQALSAGMGK